MMGPTESLTLAAIRTEDADSRAPLRCAYYLSIRPLNGALLDGPARCGNAVPGFGNRYLTGLWVTVERAEEIHHGAKPNRRGFLFERGK
jgi:hypothetical protein